MGRTPLAAAALAALVLLSACASDPPRSREDATEYDCNGRTVDRAAYEERAPLSGSARTALAEAARAEGREMDLSAGAGWFTLAESATKVEVFRELAELEDLGTGGMPSDHEYLAIELVDMDGSGRSWHSWSSSPCALRLDIGGLGMATVALADAPDPASRDLDLLVDEHACNSGEGAAAASRSCRSRNLRGGSRWRSGCAPRAGSSRRAPGAPPPRSPSRSRSPWGIVRSSTPAWSSHAPCRRLFPGVPEGQAPGPPARTAPAIRSAACSGVIRDVSTTSASAWSQVRAASA